MEAETPSSVRRGSSEGERDGEEVEIVEGRVRKADGEEASCKYLKGKLLGKGGFAKCYLATCMDTKEKYALKVVSKASLEKSSARQRQLKTEVRVHRTLSHKHIVRFEHSFETESNVYIVLELCPNKSMADLLKRRKRLEECEVQYYMLQLVSAVRHMHARGVIHRDLKLGNIFLDKNMQCKLGDLGLAAKCSKTERKQTLCGTPNYIAPEILDAKGHSFQVDLWSLGVVAYTLLVGRPPYECKDIRSTYKRILANSYSFPPNVPVSEPARHLIRCLLQTQPENRPSLDQVEKFPFLARVKPYLPASLPISTLYSSPPPDWLVIPRLGSTPSKPKKSPSSPVGPISVANRVTRESTTRRPLSVRDTNQVNGLHQQQQQQKTRLANSEPATTVVKKVAPAGHVQPRGTTQQSRQVPASTTMAAAKQRSPVVEGRVKKVATVVSSSSSSQSSSSRSHAPVSSPRLRLTAAPRAATVGTTAATRTTAAKTTSRPRLPVRSPAPTAPLTAAGRSASSRDEDRDYRRPAGGERSRAAATVRKEVSAAGVVRERDEETATRRNKEMEAAAAAAAAAANPLDVIQRRLSRCLLKAMHHLGPSSTTTCASSCSTRTRPPKLPDALKQLVPKTWVTRYCDFSEKYGIGFLLNDGCAGVHFNDSTKIVVDAYGDQTTYIERQTRMNTPEKGSGAEGVKERVFPLESYPSDLKKKVTLLKHFRNYLLNGGGIGVPSHPSSGYRGTEASSPEPGAPPPPQSSHPVYVRKWGRTPAALVFRLSSRVVQVMFYEGEEVVITEDARVITHVDAAGTRTSYSLAALCEAPVASLLKRLQHTNRLLRDLSKQCATK